MTTDENSDSESDTEELPFEKITINTDYKIKTSLEEPPTNLELKPLPDNLEYVFLEEPSFLPVIISSQLSQVKKNKLVSVLKKHKQAFAWKTTDIPGCVLRLPNVDTWDDTLKKFRMRTHGRCADKWMNDSLDNSKGVSSKRPSITSIPKEGPSMARLSKETIRKELLAWYGYDIVEDYLLVGKNPIQKVIF
ncbi:hypothetical protein Tco_0955815 [Tanacetum coccineum]|uniref:Reverse transcriptase domain-containing protein n=1 Tax=Tanacetum coccineum TaxID=301880 RepID=A0ABQ5E896_9ASTR